MIGFVLYDARWKAGSRHRERSAVTVERGDPDVGSPRHQASEVRYAETTLPVLLYCASDGRNLRIDHDHREEVPLRIIHACHEQPEALMHLRCGQADPLILVHRVEHVVNEPLQRRLSDLRHVERPPSSAQERMSKARHLQYGHASQLYVSVPRLMDSHQHEATYRYCPICSGQLKLRLLKSGEPHRPVCDECGYVIYLDPKVAVGTIITDGENRIALVRRAIEPGYGKWVFPGGYVDRGEELLTAAVREALEEAALRIKIDGLINLYSYPGRTAIIVVYAASVGGGDLRAEDESLEAAWFRKTDLPWSKLAFQSTRDALHDYLSGVRHPLTLSRRGCCTLADHS